MASSADRDERYWDAMIVCTFPTWFGNKSAGTMGLPKTRRTMKRAQSELSP
jgi:hypothetical protein